jgi:hypothetical protein
MPIWYLYQFLLHLRGNKGGEETEGLWEDAMAKVLINMAGMQSGALLRLLIVGVT